MNRPEYEITMGNVNNVVGGSVIDNVFMRGNRLEFDYTYYYSLFVGPTSDKLMSVQHRREFTMACIHASPARDNIKALELEYSVEVDGKFYNVPLPNVKLAHYGTFYDYVDGCAQVRMKLALCGLNDDSTDYVFNVLYPQIKAGKVILIGNVSALKFGYGEGQDAAPIRLGKLSIRHFDFSEETKPTILMGL